MLNIYRKARRCSIRFRKNFHLTLHEYLHKCLTFYNYSQSLDIDNEERHVSPELQVRNGNVFSLLTNQGTTS